MNDNKMFFYPAYCHTIINVTVYSILTVFITIITISAKKAIFANTVLIYESTHPDQFTLPNHALLS